MQRVAKTAKSVLQSENESHKYRDGHRPCGLLKVLKTPPKCCRSLQQRCLCDTAF